MNTPAPSECPLPRDRYTNREISWLDFNARVLASAEDPRTPLLERVKFLAIFASNLDEFYMVRVAGLKRRQSMGLLARSADGLTAAEQLAVINEKAQGLVHRHIACFTDDVLPALRAEGIDIISHAQLSDPEKERMDAYFRQKVFPVLTPLAVDPAHPFPYISGRSLNLAVVIREPGSKLERFARVKIPPNVDRFVGLGGDRFLPLESLIEANLDGLFPGMEVVAHHPFRVTRNADLDVEEDRDEDLLQALERELARRRFGPAVRLEVTDTMDQKTLDLLTREIDIDPGDVLVVPGLLDLSSLWAIFAVDRPDLKDDPYVPGSPARLAKGDSFFDVLRGGDVLLHHPYDSFATTTQKFIEQAAADPHVLAIKQTLYRTSGDSPIVQALISAAEAGKQVVVLGEIKARFDEEANISWARALERAGCHVVYGIVGLKTHCKTALVVRQEGGSLRRYCHIGTGNYNPKTARLYEDLGLLTADPDVGADLTDLFNVLTGYSRQQQYRKLLVAPHGVRSGLIERIEREAEHARSGREAHIIIKSNHIVDEASIDALYRASQDGVRVDLVIRTNCSVRPGVPGLSENIRVRSIVGRFLEHSRVAYFRNAGEPEIFIGSADLMHRNLDRRVEVLVRVDDQYAKTRITRMIRRLMDDDIIGWDLQPDGTWINSADRSDGVMVDAQVEQIQRIGTGA
ncbi:RNA degradosome polyphosphate kinase [Blastococcus sp. Marseille-P5729]|uniref:RNA degradosome polyphosphate kinase n=1 Tax=Blastococcus sp. Marseille-P5729 TaxID=2086582 RepID=UPI000D0FC7E3|nr:RNA degradosome polyphosphate kinase [Blastococcus sp. Marseille-P5729]